jgi:hypothetical protein
VNGFIKHTNAKKVEAGIKAKDGIKAKLQQCLEELKNLNTKKSGVSSVNSSKVGPVDDFRSTSEYKKLVKQYYQNNPEEKKSTSNPANALRKLEKIDMLYKESQRLTN